MTEKNSTDLTILLVEDVEDSRYFMRLELEHHGYRVIEAEDGEKAVELALRERPNIILMDLTLPGIDGLEATRRLLCTSCQLRAYHPNQSYSKGSPCP